ncbi:acyl-CoA dehydrogenase family protein [Pseudoroseomonas cervicalis]|uniref:acyl-CoA dehydrogenase family protein n=1 Tax=Teichococcus cervicalis TaxID=204525 RepID=UPI0035E8FFD4
MDFDLTEEQRLLKDSVDRLVADSYGDFEKRKHHQDNAQGYSPALWSQYAELGLLGLPFTEEQGGFGGGPVETMIVMEALGRGLALEPYLASVVLGGGFLRLGGSDAQREALIPALVEGSATLAFAQIERQSRNDLHDVATTARRTEAGWVLDGAKSLVLHGDSATHLIVSARTAGARGATATASPCSSCRRMRRASAAAAMPPRTGCARPRSCSRAPPCRPRPCWARKARARR